MEIINFINDHKKKIIIGSLIFLFNVAVLAAIFLLIQRSAPLTPESRKKSPAAVMGDKDSVSVNVAETGAGAAPANEDGELKIAAQKEPAVKLQFYGDIMLDRNVFNQSRKNGFEFVFSNMDKIRTGADFNIANLEGPITDNPSVSLGKDRMVFTFSPKFLPALKKYFEAFSLANNHTLNFGEKGLTATRDYLSKNEILYFGDPNNNEKYLTRIIEKNGLKIALIGYHALYKAEGEKIAKEIERVGPESDYVIIYPHWGNEYKKIPSALQEKEGKMFIDRGADLIIGSHPHVMETVEEYKGKYIFYSLGNFIFDQYFSVDTMQGLSVKVDLFKENDKIKTGFKLIPITINKSSQPESAGAKKRNEILQWLSDNSRVSGKVKGEIREGAIKMISQ